MKKFPYIPQLNSTDCGPTCLRMIARYYGRNFSAQTLWRYASLGKDGVNLLGICEAAEKIGFHTSGVKVTVDRLLQDAPLPCILHWGNYHFVVVYKIQDRGKKCKIFIADPAIGLLTYNVDEFEKIWASTSTDGKRIGIALLLEPTASFYDSSLFDGKKNHFKTLEILFRQVWKYRSLLVQVFFGLLAGSVLQLVFPFLTKSVVDIGIQNHNFHFVYLVFGAQLALMVGKMSIEFVRSWILLHISTRVNLSILSDFLSKLLRLPIAYFDSKNIGDILQRIGDHHRIEQFLTGTSLNVLFSVFNLVVFSVVLAFYGLTILGVFLLGSILYIVWILLFLRQRRLLDYKQFALGAQSQNSLIQLIASAPELKLNNAEVKKRWEWENIQVRDFKLSVKGLALQQYQQSGALFLNEGKNIVITFLAAIAVINDQMTVGTMMALQYIIGQLNSPVEQLVNFIQHWQDAKISLERLNEIHELEDEDSNLSAKGTQVANNVNNTTSYLLDIKGNNITGINVQNLSFTFAGAGNEPVLKNINLHIPAGKTTAIVGSSGSGKTTLLKLLLRFYIPQQGYIHFPFIGNIEENHELTLRHWRSLCGTVLQDGFIFSDSIINNISICEEAPDMHRVRHAIKVANIKDFISSLPLGLDTKIGAEGNGISQGQKQRILIARAVYKNPEYLFFDEATNALDTENEAVIIKNLNDFFHGKTVIVVAHRLSTVKNADQIVVLEKGEIIEIGTHHQLLQQHGRYFELISNQLELGA